MYVKLDYAWTMGSKEKTRKASSYLGLKCCGGLSNVNQGVIANKMVKAGNACVFF